MSDRVRFLIHKGHRVLLCDFNSAGRAEALAALTEIQDTVARETLNSVLTLGDFTDAEIDRTVATRMKEVLARDRPYVKRSAWVGVEDLPKVFYDNFKAF